MGCSGKRTVQASSKTERSPLTFASTRYVSTSLAFATDTTGKPSVSSSATRRCALPSLRKTPREMPLARSPPSMIQRSRTPWPPQLVRLFRGLFPARIRGQVHLVVPDDPTLLVSNLDGLRSAAGAHPRRRLAGTVAFLERPRLHARPACGGGVGACGGLRRSDRLRLLLLRLRRCGDARLRRGFDGRLRRCVNVRVCRVVGATFVRLGLVFGAAFVRLGRLLGVAFARGLRRESRPARPRLRQRRRR